MACICAGASANLAWLGQYVYEVRGFDAGINLGLVFVKVIHGAMNFRTGLPVGGGKQKVASWSVTEYFRILPGGDSQADCMGFSWPYSRKWCGLESILHTEAEIVLSDSSDMPDVTWADYDAYAYSSDGTARYIDAKPKGPKTPESVRFVAASGQGQRATRTLQAHPSHCHNGSWHVGFDQYGQAMLKKPKPARSGWYYPPRGGLEVNEPPVDSADDGRFGVLAPVNAGAPMRAVSDGPYATSVIHGEQLPSVVNLRGGVDLSATIDRRETGGVIVGAVGKSSGSPVELPDLADLAGARNGGA